MKKPLIRTGILLAAMLALSLIADLGWLDLIVASPIGLVAYWLLNGALFLFLIFGVARPWLDYWSQSDAQLARFMTMLYRRRR